MGALDTVSLTGPVLPPAKLAHVVLRTGNLKSMVAFYKAFLGAHTAYENEWASFLTYDDEHHRIAIIAFPGCAAADPATRRGTAGLEHIAFTYNNIPDLLTAYKQRKARGMLPVWSVNHGPTTSMYYQDPDGNQIETQVDNFDSAEAATAYIMGPEFSVNPLGVDFDPEELIRRVESGEDEASLKKRKDIGSRGLDSVPVPPNPDVRESYEPIVTGS